MMTTWRFLYNSLLCSQLSTVYYTISKARPSRFNLPLRPLPQEKAMPGRTLLKRLEVWGRGERRREEAVGDRNAQTQNSSWKQPTGTTCRLAKMGGWQLHPQFRGEKEEAITPFDGKRDELHLVWIRLLGGDPKWRDALSLDPSLVQAEDSCSNQGSSGHAQKQICSWNNPGRFLGWEKSSQGAEALLRLGSPQGEQKGYIKSTPSSLSFTFLICYTFFCEFYFFQLNKCCILGIIHIFINKK